MINKIIRNLKEPLQLVKKIIQQYKNSKKFTQKEKDYWDSFKNIHKGKQGFVICNGPSLKMEDLDKLKDEVCIASNKIYLAFEETDWRPTYYTTADVILWEKIKNEITTYFENIHIPNYLDGSNIEKAVYWNSKYMGIKKRFSGDMSKATYGGHTITYENLQLAVHLGLNPIYLIGCDHNYPGEKDVKAGKVIKQTNEQSHFIKNYRKAGEIVMPASIIDMEIAYTEAKKYADSNGIKILNATRGGHLEIFERISFDSILKKNV